MTFVPDCAVHASQGSVRPFLRETGFFVEKTFSGREWISVFASLLKKQKNMDLQKKILDLFSREKNKEKFYPLFLRWFSDPRDREKKDAAMGRLWRDAGRARVNVDAAWENVNARTMGPVRTSRYRIRHRAVWAAAACLAVPLLSFLVYRLVSDNADDTAPVYASVTVSPGETRTVVLPDESVVTLNSCSSLSWQEGFPGKERIVRLDGEAYFDVSSNPERPFIVETRYLKTRVLGTAFNIRSYPEGRYSEVSVAEGRVSVTCIGSSEVVLGVSDRLRFSPADGTASVSEVKPADISAWRRGEINFKGADMSEVAATLGRVFDVSITYTDDAKFGNARITARFSTSQGLREILDVLRKLIPGMDYSISEDKVHLF